MRRDGINKQMKQVMQGLPMVNGSRCSAWIVQLKWRESRAATPLGKHQITGLGHLGGSVCWRLERGIEVWRGNLRFVAQI